MPAPYRYFLYPFGIQANDLAALPDTPPVNNSVNYQTGWPDPYELNLLTDPTALPMPRGAMNQLMLDITNNIQEYQQYGAPQWVSGLVFNPVGPVNGYPIFARVYYSGQVYESQTANNTTTPGSDPSWLQVSGNFQGVEPGTVIDFAGPIAPSGYLACTGTTASPITVSRTTYARLLAAITQTQNVTTTLSTTVSGLTGCLETMYINMPIESPNSPSGNYIASITNDTTIVLNAAMTTAGATTIQFFNHGNGDGSSTFTLPSLGYTGTMGTTTNAISGTVSQSPGKITGQSGGEVSHTQTTGELVAHAHGISLFTAAGASPPANVAQGSSSLQTTGGATAATATGSPFNVIGPTLILNKCIKF